MKQLAIIFIYILISKVAFSQNTLSGKVTCKDNALLEGAVVYIPDLKTGAVVHEDGMYTIKNLPKGTFLVETHLVGYADEVVSVNIDGAIIQDFKPEASVIEEQEVVITGNSLARTIAQTPQQTAEVGNEYLWENSSTNVIDAIAKTPGVSAMTVGQSISKPVIRGLGYNRVLTVNDGVIQMDQVWFDEFGIEADPDAVDRVEILKGPASLAYGSDAIAGVINLIPEGPLPEGQIKGDIRSNYQSNNGLVNNMVHIGGTNGGISWGARVDYTLAHAYQNSYDGYVLNSQFNNFNVDATLGIHRKWGYSQLHASYFNMATGIVDGTRDTSGQMMRQVSYPDLNGGDPTYVLPTNPEKMSYTPFCINQRIQHTKVVWDNSIAVGKGRITGIFSFQRNQRQETNDPTIPNTPDIYYHSNAATYDLRYVSQNWSGFDFSAGVNGAYQSSESRGTLMLIPDYRLFQLGAFAIANYKYKDLTLSGGLRYDIRMFTGVDHWVDSTTQAPVGPTDANAYHEFTGFSTNFSGISASLGATYNFKHNFYVKANIARGFRAPSVVECAANGVHDGTVVWEIGNPNLKPETSLEEDITIGMNSKDINFELDLFNNNIHNFIYAQGLKTAAGDDSVQMTFNTIFGADAPVYKYTQGNAQLYGGEAMLDIHPTAASWFDFNATFSMVMGGLNGVADSVKVLPFVPPMKLTADVKLYLNQFGKSNPMGKVMQNTYIKFGFLYAFQQGKVYQQSAVYNGFDPVGTPEQYAASKAATPGYILFNVGAGTHIVNRNGRTVAKVSFIINNLFNTTYMDYMSRFKYGPVNPATGRVGVFNMGRNFSLKLDVPINFKKG